jgi:hypothetical protein
MALGLAIRSGSRRVVLAFIKRVREAAITAHARELAMNVGVGLDEQSLSKAMRQGGGIAATCSTSSQILAFKMTEIAAPSPLKFCCLRRHMAA